VKGLGRLRLSLPLLSALGVFSAAVVAVCLNVLVSRFYARWDVTTRGIYTLSDATLDTLRSLEEPIQVTVFLSISDPLTVSVQHMLAAYNAETTRLVTRFVDPDRTPAEFLALQNEYGILAGKTEDGRIVTDASIVIARGDKHWYVTTEDMVVYDEEDGRARPALEQALTEGIRNVLAREKIEICFTRGHEELSADDGGPQGLAELKHRVQKDNYVTRTVDLVAPRSEPLTGCGVVIVPGPEVPWTPSAAQRLEAYYDAGGNLLLLLNPVLDEGNRIRSTGLERIAEKGGIALGGDFIIERDRERRMPQGLGETFFVVPEEHAITKGMLGFDAPKYLALLTAAQSLRATEGGSARPLLTTSDRAFSVRDIRPFVEEGRAVEKRAGDAGGPFAVAMASERPRPSGSKADHGPRLVVVGSANVAFGRSWRDATLLGNRLFVESALSWLAAQPRIVSVPEKASHAAGLSLTEDDLRDILWYVLLYMPGAALLLGGLILLRRRSSERRSRAAARSAPEARSDAGGKPDEPKPDEPTGGGGTV
jgi:hypothetical protein